MECQKISGWSDWQKEDSVFEKWEEELEREEKRTEHSIFL
jgi:hypothetical protein